MARKTLTDRAVKALKPAPAGQRYEVSDAIVPGLAVRVTEKGRRTFVLVARYPGSGNPARRALGEYGVLTLDQARTKARRWLELIAKGVDPRVEEERRQRVELRRQANTFAAVAEEYIRDHVAKKRKGREVERDIRREFISRWGHRPISDVTRSDVIELIKEVKGRGAPYQARNLLGYLKTLFDWAIEQDVYGLGASPCDRIRPSRLIGEKMVRKRVLTDDELRRVWQAAKETGYPFGPLVQLLILTGQRKSEVAEASWDEIDLGLALWTIPKERMKSDVPHLVPLAPKAVEILEALPRWNGGDFLFTTTAGVKPVNGFSKAKARLDRIILERMRGEAREQGQNAENVELGEWRLHDLRRTARTHFSAIPSQDLVRELVISHARPGLHRVYDQHLYLAEKRALLEAWAARLRSIVEPPPENVVKLRAEARA